MTEETTSDQASSFVLVVDDDAARSLYTKVLTRQGYRAVEACNGADALKIARTAGGRPCLIILDLIMPVMDGLQFCRYRASDPELARVPVVMVSAAVDQLIFADSLDIDAILQKPVDLGLLCEYVAKWGSGACAAARRTPLVDEPSNGSRRGLWKWIKSRLRRSL